MLAGSDRESVEVADDLVTVTKAHKDVGKADVAGIEIRVVADSTVPVAFRLVEQLPEGVSMDDVAVHPQFSPEKWTISEAERRMVFEDVVDPGEEVVTLYGVREAKHDGLEPFLAEPEIAISQQVDPGTTSDGRGRLFRGAAVSTDDGGSGSADGAIDLDGLLGDDDRLLGDEPGEPAGPEPAAEDAPAPSNEAPDGDGTFVFEMAGPGTDDAGEGSPGAVERPAALLRSPGLGNASVVSAFIDELEREELGDEQLTALRDALDLEPAESMRLRVSHLQSEVADLSAYADEFERFVDREGSFSGALDEFREDVDGIEGQVADLSADVRAATEERSALRDQVDRLERELASFRETHESSVGRLSSRIDDVAAESVAAGEVEAVREELRAERAWRRKVVQSLESLAEDAADRDLER